MVPLNSLGRTFMCVLAFVHAYICACSCLLACVCACVRVCACPAMHLFPGILSGRKALMRKPESCLLCVISSKGSVLSLMLLLITKETGLFLLVLPLFSVSFPSVFQSLSRFLFLSFFLSDNNYYFCLSFYIFLSLPLNLPFSLQSLSPFCSTLLHIIWFGSSSIKLYLWALIRLLIQLWTQYTPLCITEKNNTKMLWNEPFEAPPPLLPHISTQTTP